MCNICLKAYRKLRALTKAVKFLLIKKKRILFKAFTESQFKYCPLSQKLHGRQINDKINKLHEITVRLVYNDTTRFLNNCWLSKNFYDSSSKYLIIGNRIDYEAVNVLPVTNLGKFSVRSNHNYNLRSKSE